MLIKPSLEHRCNRRQALRNVACGFGHTALMGMLAAESTAQSDSKQSTGLHHSGKAKCVIFLFMHGGVSHVDTFDPKPELDRLHGQPSPIKKPDFNFAETGTIFRSPWKFKNYGAGAQILSDLGLSDIILLTNNPKKPVALDSYGLKIIGYKPLK